MSGALLAMTTTEDGVPFSSVAQMRRCAELAQSAVQTLSESRYCGNVDGASFSETLANKQLARLALLRERLLLLDAGEVRKPISQEETKKPTEEPPREAVPHEEPCVLFGSNGEEVASKTALMLLPRPDDDSFIVVHLDTEDEDGGSPVPLPPSEVEPIDSVLLVLNEEPENCDGQSICLEVPCEGSEELKLTPRAALHVPSPWRLSALRLVSLCGLGGFGLLACVLRASLVARVKDKVPTSSAVVDSARQPLPRRGLILLVEDVWTSPTPFITTLIALAG